MKISRAWLQRYFHDELPDAAEIAHALMFHAFEIEGVEAQGADQIIDVKVTPNRGHDALSHRSIAREIGAALRLPLRSEADVCAQAPNLAAHAPSVQVEVTSPNVHRYIAGVVRGVRIGPSPEWLRTLLESIGQRSINSVVDATNFVMFSIGQPLHAFDIAKLAEKEGRVGVRVREARGGESIHALDSKTYALEPGMMVIADWVSDSLLGIAGVKGGVAAEIDTATTDILIEAAHFDGVSIRKTAQALKLRTDASQRFEQRISPELAAYGMRMVVDLITEIAGGTVEGFVDYYPKLQAIAPVTISRTYIERLLGTPVRSEEVFDTLTRLGFTLQVENDVFVVTPPPERLDIEGPEDLVEEVGRSIGYDRIPNTPLPAPEKPIQVNQHVSAAEKIRESLIAEGYSEVYTSVFQQAGDVAVKNKLGGDKPYLRSTLLVGLQEALQKNIPFKDLLHIKEVRLFEIGTVWKEGKEVLMVGTVREKQPAEEHELLPEAATQYDAFPVSTAQRFRPFSRFPYMVRDIALWVPQSVAVETIQSLIETHAGTLLNSLRLFDRFEKQERVSYAFRLVFQSFERTLTDVEVADVMERITAALRAEGYEIR